MSADLKTILATVASEKVEGDVTRMESLVRQVFSEAADTTIPQRKRAAARDMIVKLVDAASRDKAPPQATGERTIVLAVSAQTAATAQLLVDKAMAAVTTSTGGGRGA